MHLEPTQQVSRKAGWLAAAGLILVLLSGFFILERTSGIHVSTDLRSITPRFIANPELNDVIGELSDSIGQQFMVVIRSASAGSAETAAGLFLDALDNRPSGVEVVDATEQLQGLAPLLVEHRFQLLTAEQSADIEASSDAELENRATRRLYGLASGGLFSPAQDPAGYLGDYVLQVGESFDDSTEIQNNGFTYVPFTFRVVESAGDFDRQQDVLAFFRLTEERILAELPEVAFLHSGVFFFAADAATAARADIGLISGGSTLGILLLVLLVFRTPGPVSLSVFSILAGTAVAFLTGQLLFGSLHIFTIVFGASLIGVVIDYAFHFAFHCREKQRSRLFRALLLSLFTSVIGYGAMAFSGLGVLTQVAVFSVVGLMTAWLVVWWFGDLFLARLSRIHDGLLRMAIRAVNARLAGLGGRVVLGVAVGTLLLAGGITVVALQVDDSPRSFITQNPELLQQQAELDPLLALYEPAVFMVVSATGSEALYESLSGLREIPGSEGMLAIDDFLPSAGDQARNYRLNARLYAADGAAVRMLRQVDAMTLADDVVSGYEQAADRVLDPGELFGDLPAGLPPLWSEREGKQYALVMLPRGADLPALASYARQHEEVEFIDTVSLATGAIRQLRTSAMVMLGMAIVLITGVLWLRHRQVSGVRPVLVPVLSVLLTLAVFAVTGVPLTLFHVMALFLVLGLGMDYVIFSSELVDEGEQTLSAVVLSSATSLLAFGLLSISAIPVVAAFGITLVIGNAINTLGSFVVARFPVRQPGSP